MDGPLIRWRPKNVTTKIGQRFLTLIDKHIPKNHKLHKIFNRNTIKISYSCMPNIKSIINSHNKNILYGDVKLSEKACNCIKKSLCPLNNNCLSNNIVYQATVSSNKPQYSGKVYIGISETSFKLRYANHLKSFNIKKYKNDTHTVQYMVNLVSMHESLLSASKGVCLLIQ